MHSSRPSPFASQLRPLRHLLGLTLLVASAAAQDLDRLEPAPVPAQVSAPVEPPPAEPAAPALLGMDEGETVLLPELRGVAFYATAEAAAAAEPGPGVAMHDLPLLNPQATEVVAEFFLNHPVSRPGLNRLALGVRTLLRQAGYPFSVVYLPPQDITSGVVRFVVTVSQLDTTVRVEGARYFDAELYQEVVRLAPGETLNQEQFDADIAWINRNPFRAAWAEVVAGERPGTSQVLVRVNERRPWRVFASADNTGTQTTKEERFTAGVNWGNAFGLGHQVSAQWNSSWDFETLRSGSGSYIVDLPWRHTVSVSGAYSVTNGFVAPPFALKGTSWQVGLNYEVPLASPRPEFTHALRLGADFKSSDNNFTFAAIPITDNLTHVAQFRATYSGSLSGDGSRTGFGVTVTAAPGGLTDRNEDEFFNLSRAGAKAAYVFFSANASHTISLDRIVTGLSWSLRAQAQLSPTNLIGSEQFSGGGTYSVRGYEEGEVFKDNGGLLSQEVRLPPWSLRGGHQIQPYVFQDYAYLWSTDELPDEAAVDLHSAGVGVDYFYGRHLSLRAAYGWQFLDSGSSETGDNSRLHISANLSF